MKKTRTTLNRLQKPPEDSAPPMFKSRSQREKYDRHCAAGGQAFADLDMRSRHDDAVLLDEIAAVIHGVNREHYQFEQLVNGTAHCLTLQSPDIADLRLGLERRQTACPDFNTSALSDLVLKTTACGYGTPSQGCGEIDPPLYAWHGHRHFHEDLSLRRRTRFRFHRPLRKNEPHHPGRGAEL